MSPRLVSAAQILIVIAGVFTAVYGLSRFGLGAGGQALSPSLGMFVHVSALALISVGLSWLVLVREPSQLGPLGLSLEPLRGRVPLMVLYGLAGGVATYGINAVVSIGFIMVTGGIEKHIGMAKEQHEALSTFAAIPLWVMIPVVVIAGTYEDIVFRGFLLGRLRILLATRKGWIGDVLSVAISSIIFGLGHVYQGWFGVMKTTAAGVCLAILVLLTKSVWPAMIAHAGIDASTIVMLHFLSPIVDKALEGK